MHTSYRRILSTTVHAMWVNGVTLSIIALCTAPAYAQATTGSPMSDVLCTVLAMIILGNLGRGLATAAVLMLGIGAVMGKVSWGLAVTMAIGISVMYGAVSIISSIAGIPDVCQPFGI